MKRGNLGGGRLAGSVGRADASRSRGDEFAPPVGGRVYLKSGGGNLDTDTHAQREGNVKEGENITYKSSNA